MESATPPFFLLQSYRQFINSDNAASQGLPGRLVSGEVGVRIGLKVEHAVGQLHHLHAQIVFARTFQVSRDFLRELEVV